jgi:DNA-binding NarL/FixJ family response regulator
MRRWPTFSVMSTSPSGLIYRSAAAKFGRRRRQRDAGVATIRKAWQTFDDLGSQVWADRAKAELARGKSGRQRSEGLTPSERRVAELAVSGVTNRDIAAALFISPKTVEVNLSRIYRKLKVRSRMELYRAWQSGQIDDL